MMSAPDAAHPGLLRRLAALALLLALAACSGLDAEQARLCERLVPALETADASIVVTAREPDAAAGAWPS